MNHIEKLQDYLIADKEDKKGYLKKDISKGKVLMLSGAWGSGKTYFWREKIEKKNNIYISLYGKTSISDIQNEIITKSILNEFPDNKNLIDNVSTLTNITKNISSFFIPKSGEVIDKVEKVIRDKLSKHSLEEGILICFDDFERKSKEIDLNDLFGFITQFAINIKCRVVIILNSDVFKSEEEKIFTNLKEKSVSKYISFSPKCDELFDLIFDSKEKLYNKELKNHKDILKKSFKETNIINARIMIQVLDNILEWIEDENIIDDDTLRLLVLVNINFILNHQVYEANIEERDTNGIKNLTESIASIGSNHQSTHYPKKMESYIVYEVKYNQEIHSNIYKEISKHITNNSYNENILKKLKYLVEIDGKENLTKSGKADYSQTLLDYIDNNSLYIKSEHFMICFKINTYCEEDEEKIEIFNKVNSFIEMGIL